MTSTKGYQRYIPKVSLMVIFPCLFKPDGLRSDKLRNSL